MPLMHADKMAFLAEVKSRLASVYGDRLKGVVLYGSEARGDAGVDSDIDLLVLLDGEVDYGNDLLRNINALYPMSAKLGRRLSPKPIPAFEYDHFQCPLFLNAHKEGVRL